MIGDLTRAPEPIQIKLFSQDPKLLEQWAPRVADAIGKKIDGRGRYAQRHRKHHQRAGGTFRWTPAAARAGFTAEEVASTPPPSWKASLHPRRWSSNDRAYTLRVRFPAANRASLEAMSNTLLVSTTGQTATLGSLATVTENAGQTEIRAREPAARRGGHGAPGRLDLGSGMAAVQKVVAGLHLPSAFASNTAEPTRNSSSRSTTW